MSTGKVRGVRYSKRGPRKLSSNRRFITSRRGNMASVGSCQINFMVLLLCSLLERTLEAHKGVRFHLQDNTREGGTLSHLSHNPITKTTGLINRARGHTAIRERSLFHRCSWQTDGCRS